MKLKQTHALLNLLITEKGNRRYSAGIKLATTALLISILLMTANK
jgi:hypothetical protein